MKDFTEISEAMNYVKVEFVSLYFITPLLNFCLKKTETPFHYHEWRTMGKVWLSIHPTSQQINISLWLPKVLGLTANELTANVISYPINKFTHHDSSK